jgi:NAD(P)-dependent dehydrogenase (short-subunit alcohol dehydrogenase family)
MISFTRQSALITGAASGIGAATAKALCAAGVTQIALLDRDAEGLAATRDALPLAETEVLLFVHDVADEAAWDATTAKITERFAGIDLVVANAGIAAGGEIADFPFQEWRRLMAVNLDGVFLTLQAGFRLMRSGKRTGAIVVVASAAAVKAERGAGAYGASKAAVLQLAKVAAKEGAAHGIRVNAILPGGVETPIWTQTEIFRDLVREHGSERAAFDAIAKMATPLGRYATAEEIAGQIAFLLSPAAATITGVGLVSDGGYVG